MNVSATRKVDALRNFKLYERAVAADVIGLIVAPTITGKSYIARSIIREAVKRRLGGVRGYLVPGPGGGAALRQAAVRGADVRRETSFLRSCDSPRALRKEVRLYGQGMVRGSGKYCLRYEYGFTALPPGESLSRVGIVEGGYPRGLVLEGPLVRPQRVPGEEV